MTEVVKKGKCKNLDDGVVPIDDPKKKPGKVDSILKS